MCVNMIIVWRKNGEKNKKQYFIAMAAQSYKH